MSFVCLPNKLDHVKHGVYISNWNSATDEKLLAHHGIKCVLCINNVAKQHHELNVYKKLRINHFQINAEDTEVVDLKKWFAKTNYIIHYCVKREMPVLVHCTAGISRSVTIVMAYFLYLIHCRGKYRPGHPVINRLYRWIKTKREYALPNPGFYKQLEEFEMDCLGME